MEALTNNEIYILQSHGYLLECTIATYESMALKKRTPKGELDRHESIIRGAFEAIWPDLARARENTSQYYKGKWKYQVRVDEILGNIKREGLEAGVQRYFNKIRYGIGAEHGKETTQP